MKREWLRCFALLAALLLAAGILIAGCGGGENGGDEDIPAGTVDTVGLNEIPLPDETPPAGTTTAVEP
jgi:hypothetical protein